MRRGLGTGNVSPIQGLISSPLPGTRSFGLWRVLLSDLVGHTLMRRRECSILATCTLYISGVKVYLDLCESRFFMLRLCRVPRLGTGEWRVVRLGLPKTAWRWLGYARHAEER